MTTKQHTIRQRIGPVGSPSEEEVHVQHERLVRALYGSRRQPDLARMPDDVRRIFYERRERERARDRALPTTTQTKMHDGIPVTVTRLTPSAQRQLAHEYATKAKGIVYRYFRFLGLDPDEPTLNVWHTFDELINEVYGAILMALATYDPQRDVPVDWWIRFKAINRLADTYRREWRHQRRRIDEYSYPNDSGVPLEDNIPEPEPEFDRATVITVLDAVDTLKPAYRTVVALVYLQGLTHQAAADTLGISAKAVEHRLDHAKKFLRRIDGLNPNGEKTK